MRVSLVQPNFQVGPKWLNIYFLPYSVGCIWTYAQTRTKVKNNYQLDHIIWRRDPIDDCAKKLSESDVVVFSTYIWNRNYNYALAQEIKKIRPEVITVFGGPEPAVTDPGIFEKNPFIDYVIKKEGEIAFADLLCSLIDPASELPPGLLYNQNNKVVDTGDFKRIDDLSMLPSPYLAGFFDKIIADNPTVSWNSTLETNRGCPYQCTFCDWGSLTYNKVRQFPIDRVFADVDWICDNTSGVYLADANFGMFIDRDRDIVQRLIKSQSRTNKLNHFYANWAKNQRTEVIELIKLLSDHTPLISNGLTVSVQSMTPEVLDIIKRTNLKQHKIQEMYELADRNNLYVYTEVIVGLPGESYRSLQQTIFDILEAGLHHGIDIVQSQLLENAEMNLVQKEIHNIKSIEMSDYIMMHQDSSDGTPIETVATVVETSTMPHDDMVETLTWISFMQAFHFYGFSTQISKFLRKYSNKPYKDFYTKLWNYVQQDQVMSNLLNDIRSQARDWLHHGYLPSPCVHTIKFNGINLWAGLTIMIFEQHCVDYVWQLLQRFLDQHYPINKEINRDLFIYQKMLTTTYDRLQQPEIQTLSLEHDIPGYIKNEVDINQHIDVEFSFKSVHRDVTFPRYLESIYVQRKQRFGLLDAKVV